jgi:hypothetical protein
LGAPSLDYDPLDASPGVLPEPGLPDPDRPADPGLALDFPLFTAYYCYWPAPALYYAATGYDPAVGGLEP